MDGDHPAAVPPGVLDGIRSRERNGLIRPPHRGPQRGDQVRIVRGPLMGQLAIYAGQSGAERVAVLLQILGARLNLPAADIEPVTLDRPSPL